MRKLALVLGLLGGLAACSKNKAAPAAPSNTAAEPAPGGAGEGGSDGVAPSETSPGNREVEEVGAPPPPSDPCSGGE